MKIALFLALFSLFTIEHPFYVSVTDIKYNASQATLELSQRVFRDDLEVEINQLYNTNINILNPESESQLNSILEKYLSKVNEVWVNGKSVDLQYLGYELEDDVIWFYLEGKNVEVPEQVKIRNTVLFGSFKSQQNIINFYTGSKPRSVITKRGRESGELRF